MKRLSSATNASEFPEIRTDATGEVCAVNYWRDRNEEEPSSTRGSLQNLREQVCKPGSVPSA